MPFCPLTCMLSRFATVSLDVKIICVASDYKWYGILIKVLCLQAHAVAWTDQAGDMSGRVEQRGSLAGPGEGRRTNVISDTGSRSVKGSRQGAKQRRHFTALSRCACSKACL